MNLFEDEEESEGGEGNSRERWIVSYADFVTTLFALFVLLFALATRDARKGGGDALKVGYTSVAQSIGAQSVESGETAAGDPDKRAAADLRAAYSDLAALKSEIDGSLQGFTNSGVSLKITDEGLVISLAAARFFNSGDDSIRPEQIVILDRICERLGSVRNPMRVEGFTDSVPIRSARFKDNWDLSAARAGNVLRHMLARAPALDARRLSLAGYGPYRPVASNDTESGRALNRRVDIIIRPISDQTGAHPRKENG